MDTQTKYSMNHDYILRPEDRSVFSVERMQIYQFNESGFDLLQFFAEESQTYEDWISYAHTINSCSEKYLKDFFDQTVICEILTETT